MAMNRAQFAKMLEPGLNTLFGLEYDQYPAEYAPVFSSNTSQKAYEEDVLLEGFSNAPVKSEGAAVSYDAASQQWTARYQHETIALAFSITEEAEEDGQYGSISSRYTKALARSMASTKEIKAANVLNNAFSGSGVTGGDGKTLCATDHGTRSLLRERCWLSRLPIRLRRNGCLSLSFGLGLQTTTLTRSAPEAICQRAITLCVV
jgi:hypothetical protein